MILADAGRALLTATIPIAYAIGRLGWPQLYAISFLLGSLSVGFNVSSAGFFQTLIPRDRYVDARSLLEATRGTSFLFGTSLGGALVQVLSGPYALAADAASFVWSALFLGQIKAEEPPGAPLDSGGPMSGMRWIRRNEIIRAELLGVATINLCNFIYLALFTLYATRSLHVRPGTLGVIMGSAGVGALAASAFTGKLARRIGIGPALIIGCLGPAPLILIPAAAGPHWAILVFLFAAELLSAVGVTVLDIAAGAINTAVVPPVGRSRVSGAFMVVNYGVRPVGTVLAGVLGSSIGVRPTLWIATIGGLAGLIFLLPSPIRTLRDLPTEPAAF